jgi:major type 1 subunit fimbrin (pilin)
MNKHLISSALVAVFALSAVATASAQDGKITFDGSVSDSTCTVTGGAGAGAGKDFTVSLPSVAKGTLATNGAFGGDTSFQVTVGGAGQTGCTDGKVASLRFDSTSANINAATGRLVNKAATGAAANVEVELYSAKGSINLLTNANTDGGGAAIASNTAKLTYGARYRATGAATAGAVNTFINYSVVYN